MAYNKPDVWIRQSIKLRLGTVPPSPRRICIIGPVYHIVRDESSANTHHKYEGTQLVVPYPDGFDSEKEEVITNNVVVKILIEKYWHTLAADSDVTIGDTSVTIKENRTYCKPLSNSKIITLINYVDTSNTLDSTSLLQEGQLVDITSAGSEYHGVVKSVSDSSVTIFDAVTDTEQTIDLANIDNITIYPRRIADDVQSLSSLDSAKLSSDGSEYDLWDAIRIPDADGTANKNVEIQLAILGGKGTLSGREFTFDASTLYYSGREPAHADWVYLIDSSGNIQRSQVINYSDDGGTIKLELADDNLGNGAYACVVLRNYGSSFYYYPTDKDAPVSGEVYIFYHARRKDIVGEELTFNDGGELVEDLGIPCDQNPTVLAAHNAMSCGVPVTIVPTSGTNLASFQEVEDKLDVLDAYYFVPITTDSDVHSWLKNKVEAWSDPTYKKEAMAILGLYESSTDKNTIINNVKTYAQNLSSRRVVVVWPDRVTVPGYSPSETSTQDYDMYGDQLAAIVAGHLARSAREVYESLTATSLSVVKDISRSNDLFTEAELNSIAEGGVFIVTKHYNLFRVRHALTTDMSQVETREITITETIDTIAKSLRAMLVGMIGKPISPALLGSIRFAIERQLDYYFKYGYISDFKINSIKQSESNPDTIEVDLSVKPTYPCNYINVVLYIG